MSSAASAAMPQVYHEGSGASLVRVANSAEPPRAPMPTCDRTEIASKNNIKSSQVVRQPCRLGALGWAGVGGGPAGGGFKRGGMSLIRVIIIHPGWRITTQKK